MHSAYRGLRDPTRGATAGLLVFLGWDERRYADLRSGVPAGSETRAERGRSRDVASLGLDLPFRWDPGTTTLARALEESRRFWQDPGGAMAPGFVEVLNRSLAELVQAVVEERQLAHAAGEVGVRGDLVDLVVPVNPMRVEVELISCNVIGRLITQIMRATSGTLRHLDTRIVLGVVVRHRRGSLITRQPKLPIQIGEKPWSTSIWEKRA
jgi:hypothetical protein